MVTHGHAWSSQSWHRQIVFKRDNCGGVGSIIISVPGANMYEKFCESLDLNQECFEFVSIGGCDKKTKKLPNNCTGVLSPLKAAYMCIT
jgi:hypothetical protein